MIISINNEIITLNGRTNLAELAFKYNTFGKDVIIAVNGRIIHQLLQKTATTSLYYNSTINKQH